MGLSSLSISLGGCSLAVFLIPTYSPWTPVVVGRAAAVTPMGGGGRMLLFPRVRSSRRGGVRMGMVGAGVGAR